MSDDKNLLNSIREVIHEELDKSVTPLRDTIGVLERKVGALDTKYGEIALRMIVSNGRLESVEERIIAADDKVGLVQKDISGLKQDLTVVREELSGLKKDTAKMQKDVTKIKNDAKLTVDILDRADIQLRSRVDRVERHTGLI